MSCALLMLVLTAAPAPDVAVVCPVEFREALTPWVEYRALQGHQVALLSNQGTAADVAGRIQEVARQGKLRFVVLVGDAEMGMDQDAELRARCVPAHYVEAKINVRWGSEPTIATDNGYADLDGDRVPDVAVGRLTADSPAELSAMIEKVLAYERSRDFGPWRRRLNVVAGVGGFGRLIDTIIESAARQFLTRDIPAGYDMSMTYGSWYSPYCPDPSMFHRVTMDRLNEGAWFWVYIGHGFHLGLDRVSVPGSRHHILDVRDVPELQCARSRAPIAMFLACYTGAFDAKADCLAERLLRTPGAPVAVVAGSRVTMPYAMGVLGTGLMDECFRGNAETLGEVFLRAKRGLAQEARNDERRRVLDAVAGAISPHGSKLADERLEHIQLFNLIGDPLLRLRRAKPVQLEVAPTVAPGATLEVRGTSPVDGRCRIELVAPRGRLTFKPSSRAEFPRDTGQWGVFQDDYERANNPRWAAGQATVEGGRLLGRLAVPQNARGEARVRIYVEGASDFALGSAPVRIETPATGESRTEGQAAERDAP